MKFTKRNLKAILLSASLLTASIAPMQAMNDEMTVKTVKQINPTTVELRLENNERMTIDFYGENIFRLFQDNNGGILRDPAAKPEAKILVSNPRKQVAGMSNYSKNRLHGNGNTAVYPTFVNEGNRVTLNGDVEIAKITLKAVDGIIVDKHLNSIKF